MSQKNKTLGTLYVLAAMILMYLAQISSIPADRVAQWEVHDWIRASLFVALAGIKAWHLFLIDPQQAETKFVATTVELQKATT